MTEAQGCQWVDLPHLDLLYVYGEDAHDFLQGQITCQLDDVVNGCSHLAAHCSPKGRVLSLFQISQWQKGYLLAMPSGMADACAQAMRPYILRSKVFIETVTSTHSALGFIVTPSSCHTLPPALHALLGTLPTTSRTTRPSGGYHLIHLHGNDPARYLVVSTSADTEALRSTCQTHLHEATTQDWAYLDHTQLRPTIVGSTAGLFTPHMLNLHQLDAISFDKGCFCGQEIIARTHHLGQNKRHLHHWTAEPTQAQPADTLYDETGQAVGTLVDNLPMAAYNSYLAVIHQRAAHSPLYLDPDLQHKVKP